MQASRRTIANHAARDDFDGPGRAAVGDGTPPIRRHRMCGQYRSHVVDRPRAARPLPVDGQAVDRSGRNRSVRRRRRYLISSPANTTGRHTPVGTLPSDEFTMSRTKPSPESIYAWLSCPECGSRDIVRGPRSADGAVEITCEACGLTGWYGL
jgi:predicted RNA-binding Zn-ribbon protein involved in translation (DUF1610 family)